MEWVVFGIVVIWLAAVSYFDIRTGEVPHSAWCFVPLLGGCTYRACQGGWPLVFLAALVIVISERERIAHLFRLQALGRITTWLPLLCLGISWAVQLSPVTALAVIAFWAAWELGWWGGADAVSAISIALVWPGWVFILALLASHLMVVAGMGLFSIMRERKIRLHRVPGLPVLLATVLLTGIIQCLSG